MPRKATKIDKPALQFLERPVGGARLQNVPEVRAALHPKAFSMETHKSTTVNSWVSPQFETSLAAAPPARRARRRRQSASSILDHCSQLTRKSSVCKYPSLSFNKRSGDQSHQLTSAHARKAPDVSDAHRSRQISKAVSSVPHSEMSKRLPASIGKRKGERFSDSAAPSSRCEPETPVRIQADSDTTPAFSEQGSVGPPPDIDTPELIQEGRSCPSSPPVQMLLAQSCNRLPRSQSTDILVADTPEKDYGLKVTWRKRKSLMLLLKERGHLSDSDVLIHS